MAIQHTLYISATRLKKDTALGGSVDDNLIMPYILLAQDMHILNNAVVVMGATDQSSSATYDDLKPVMDTATNAAEFYRQRMIDYLGDKGSAAFPEYSSNTDAGELSPTTRNYYSGLNLDVNTPISNRLKGFLQGADITIYGC
jgi:hypothetical protein